MWRPTDENFLIVGGIDLWKTTDGGVFRAADIQAVGTEAEPPYVNGRAELVKNYGVTQFYGGGRQPASGKIVGGAQDNGTICFDPAAGSERWTTIFGGDGGWCAADPSDPGVFYGEYVYPDIHRDTDGGTTDDTQGDRYISGQFWNQATGEWDWKPVPFRIDDAKNPNSALFIAPFVPADPSTVSVAFGGYLSANIWATREGGTTWTNLAPACRRPGARDRGPTNGGRSSSTSAPRSACSRARTPARRGRPRTRGRPTARSPTCSGWARRRCAPPTAAASSGSTCPRHERTACPCPPAARPVRRPTERVPVDWIERVLHGSPDGGDGTVDAVYYAVAVLGVAAFAFRRRLRRSARSRRRER